MTSSYKLSDLKEILRTKDWVVLYETPDGKFVVEAVTGGACMYEIYALFSAEEAQELKLRDPFYLDRVAYSLTHKPINFQDKNIVVSK